MGRGWLGTGNKAHIRSPDTLVSERCPCDQSREIKRDLGAGGKTVPDSSSTVVVLDSSTVVVLVFISPDQSS